MENYQWIGTNEISNQHYKCGYCSKEPAPSKCYLAYDGGGKNLAGRIYICAYCKQPTFFAADGQQTPKPLLGNEVHEITDKDIANLYNEVRNCTSTGAYTAAVMVCRKILMNLAVQHGAKKKETFAYYVDFLDGMSYIPPQGKQWVDKIRKRGNEANHEITLMNIKDAQLMLHFTGALLHFNYELTSMLAAADKPKTRQRQKSTR